MPIAPMAKWRPVPSHGGRMSAHLGLVLHVQVGDGSCYGQFANTKNQASSTWWIAKDGRCLSPEHRVLTADLRWVAGGDLQVGDKLIAFDEKNHRLYREAVVEWIEFDEADLYAVVMDDGTTIHATADHRWLSQTKECWTWRRTRNAAGGTLVGVKVPKLFDVWDTRTDADAGWFTGLLDGEGTITRQHRVSFAQRPTVVLDKALDYLKTEGYEYTESSITGGRGDCRRIDIRGPLVSRLELLGSHRPVRLLPSVDIGRFGNVRSRNAEMRTVVAVYPVRQREIVKLQTSTRTFIAEGFGMHNCEQYVDSDDAAWAEADGNYTYDSVETEGQPSQPLTEAQISTLAQLYKWGHETYGWPFQLAERPGDRGLGWHGMGGARWGGHDHCPGDIRRGQRVRVIERAWGAKANATRRAAMSRFPNAVDACVIPGWLGPKGEPGVWVAGSDGGVGAYPVGAGAPFHNSIPGIGVHLNAPIRCIVPHDSGGYWLVGQDGAVFAFGNAPGIGWPPSFTYDQFFSQYQAGDRAIVNAEPFAGGLVLLADDGAFYELGTPK